MWGTSIQSFQTTPFTDPLTVSFRVSLMKLNVMTTSWSLSFLSCSMSIHHSYPGTSPIPHIAFLNKWVFWLGMSWLWLCHSKFLKVFNWDNLHSCDSRVCRTTRCQSWRSEKGYLTYARRDIVTTYNKTGGSSNFFRPSTLTFDSFVALKPYRCKVSHLKVFKILLLLSLEVCSILTSQ